MRTLTIGLLGAAALTAGLLLARTQQRSLPRPPQAEPQSSETDGEGVLFVNRLRELGI